MLQASVYPYAYDFQNISSQFLWIVFYYSNQRLHFRNILVDMSKSWQEHWVLKCKRSSLPYSIRFLEAETPHYWIKWEKCHLVLGIYLLRQDWTRYYSISVVMLHNDAIDHLFLDALFLGWFWQCSLSIRHGTSLAPIYHQWRILVVLKASIDAHALQQRTRDKRSKFHVIVGHAEVKYSQPSVLALVKRRLDYPGEWLARSRLGLRGRTSIPMDCSPIITSR